MRRAAVSPPRSPDRPYPIPSNRAPKVVPSSRNGSSEAGSIAPTVIRSVPNTAISSRKVVGRVARSMIVFCRMNGRCQAPRKSMYSCTRARNDDAAPPPKTRTTLCPSR